MSGRLEARGVEWHEANCTDGVVTQDSCPCGTAEENAILKSVHMNGVSAEVEKNGEQVQQMHLHEVLSREHLKATGRIVDTSEWSPVLRAMSSQSE